MEIEQQDINQQDPEQQESMVPDGQSDSFSDHAPPTDRLATVLSIAGKPNIIDDLDENVVTKLGRDCVRFARMDDDSRADWIKTSKEAMDIALQIKNGRVLHGTDASDIKFPLLTSAALQFHARAYPAIVMGNKTVKAQVTGLDENGEKEKQSKRVAAHMNYQLLEQNESWEEDVDKMLLAIPIEGCEFKKSYFKPELGYNVSEWVRPVDFIVNNATTSLDRCPRYTHVLRFYPYEIEQKVESKVWSDANLNITQTEEEEQDIQEFYEQYCWIEHKEVNIPVIVTVHVKSQEVVRITPNFYPEDIEIKLKGDKGTIKDLLKTIPKDYHSDALQNAELSRIIKTEYFTKFGFIPNPNGSFYDIGFGQLIGPLSDSVDTVVNQLIDAGTNSNYQGGFVRAGTNIESKRGNIEMERGVFKQITLPAQTPIGEAIYQFKFPEPSLALFNLLGMLVQSVKDITSVQDIMTGAPQGNETATTSLTRVEQGMKVFTAIYKRIYRSMKQEFKKLYKLNGKYLQPKEYFTVLDTREQGVVTLADYQNDGTDVQPVADPNIATTMMALAKSQALLALAGKPGINTDEIIKRYLDALDIPNSQAVIVPEEKRPQGDPEQNLKVMQAADQHVLNGAKLIEIYSNVILNLASAESKESGQQLEIYKTQLEAMINGFGIDVKNGAVPVENAPSNDQGVRPAPGNTGGMQTGMPGIAEPAQPGPDQGGAAGSV